MAAPLAERLRPQRLEDYIGQSHLVGKDGVFRRFIETKNVPSFILWGPPGVGTEGCHAAGQARHHWH